MSAHNESPQNSAVERARGATGDPIPLRLIAARGGLGIELYESRQLGPLTLRALSWTLPGLRFPVDLSGGVRAFRHRRGELERLRIGFRVRDLTRWLASRLRDVFGGLSEEPSAWQVDGGIGIGLTAEQGCLAFDVLWAPAADRGRLVLANPRSAGIAMAPTAAALAVLDTALSSVATRQGRTYSLGSIGTLVAGQFLPTLGVRVPGASGLWLSLFDAVRDDTSEAEFAVGMSHGSGPPALPASTVKALELAVLLSDADEHLASGRLDEARAAYVAALDQAPRQPELCQTIATIDRDFAERAEAALGLLVEALPATSFGLVGAELLSAVGDPDGAELAVTNHVRLERYAPLSALMWVRLAELSPSAKPRMDALDRALSLSPRSRQARWARFSARVTVGDVNGAVSDAEHLEAAAVGNLPRHEVIVLAAETLGKAGFHVPAARLFERALRYLPRDARSTLGLAEGMGQSGQGERTVVLLERAIELATEDSDVSARASLVLAKLLAEQFSNFPQAIARVRAVSGTSTYGVEARALEAKWRAAIGDLTGAAMAYGRLRDAIDVGCQVDAAAATRWLLEAAQFNTSMLSDIRARERNLSLALKLSPHDEQVQLAYRAAAEQLAYSSLRELAPARQEQAEVPGKAPDPELGLKTSLVADTWGEPVEELEAARLAPEKEPVVQDDGAAAENEAAMEDRAGVLRAQLLASPRPDADVALELAQLLSQLGRVEEAYAVLSAQYEDAGDDIRRRLLPPLKEVLEHLIVLLDEQGRADEAELYQMALAQHSD